MPGTSTTFVRKSNCGCGCAAGQWERAAYGMDPSGRACVFIKILKALRLPFKELTSVENKKCNGEVSGKAWGD